MALQLLRQRPDDLPAVLQAYSQQRLPDIQGLLKTNQVMRQPCSG